MGAGTQPGQPLISYVSFYRGGAKVFETAPLAATQAWENRLKTVPLQFSLPLRDLAAGEYTCQVTVLDPASGKAAFWQAPVMLAP